jgi:hypothetical protein
LFVFSVLTVCLVVLIWLIGPVGNIAYHEVITLPYA